MTSADFIVYFKKTYRNKTSSFLTGFIIMLTDVLSLFFCIGLAFFIMNLINPSAINFRSFVFYLCYFPLILLTYAMANLYPGIMISPTDEIRKLCLCSVFCLAGISISLIFQEGDTASMTSLFSNFIRKDSNKYWVSLSLLLSALFASIVMPAMREVIRHIYGRYRFWGVPAVIYCTAGSGTEIIDRLLKHGNLGYKPVIIIDSAAENCSVYKEIPVFPDSDDIFNTVRQLKIKTAILCDYKGDVHPVMSYYRYTINIPKEQTAITNSMHIKDIDGILGFAATHNLTRTVNIFIKRLTDLVLVFATLPLVLPLTLLIVIGIKLDSPGPVLFAHRRVGKNGRSIRCLKFRSMYRDSAEMLEKILAENPEMKKEWEHNRKLAQDPRITKFGKFLRKTSLDELPQLWNILIGEMSFVGPRPVTQEELEKYGTNADYILSVVPGLSGMWQISGRSDTGYEERINLDTYYIRNWSIWLDLWIIIKTIWVVVKGKGAY
ncbi:MAG: undecaprenyl-phosphate galactose phosphotransferase WbaP [Bacteroides sp.]|nr:undecaprenyl-phosphate galactose phosphotransferase WbaP [Prevotella sp.]MCM1407848.1 undecaprenyl-phosphate galactose phosphotransferase WbaP [Treponema brennaborense]MCM1469590.1 undecaprenyl-phosphate galactose phosphotransferase WbaP [Bacteroides sp.]